jgi:uncharacterized protein YcfJ
VVEEHTSPPIPATQGAVVGGVVVGMVLGTVVGVVAGTVVGVVAGTVVGVVAGTVVGVVEPKLVALTYQLPFTSTQGTALKSVLLFRAAE